MARGLPRGCARELRVIAANHATARDNAGTRHAQGRVGGAGTPGIADYNFKARSTGPSHFPQRISFVQDVTGRASIFPPDSGSALSALNPCLLSPTLSTDFSFAVPLISLLPRLPPYSFARTKKK